MNKSQNLNQKPIAFIQRFQEVASKGQSRSPKRIKTATATREEPDQARANDKYSLKKTTRRGIDKLLNSAKTHTFVAREEPDQRHSSSVFNNSQLRGPRAPGVTHTRTGREETDQRAVKRSSSANEALEARRRHRTDQKIKTLTETRESADQRVAKISALIKTATKTREEREQNEAQLAYRALSGNL